MTEFRYHRLAGNDSYWRKPTLGRLGKSNDYIGKNGFGFEDWNFARDVWEDGRFHLYIRGQCAKADERKRFNIVLGAHTKAGHVAVGFCRNVEFCSATLDDRAWKRRARQLMTLESADSLAGDCAGRSLDEKAKWFKEEAEDLYRVAVKPHNLTVLDVPILVPETTVKRNYSRYGLHHLTKAQYNELWKKAKNQDLLLTQETDDLVSEGGLALRLHTVRERDPSLVRKKKDAFIRDHGELRCEACGWRPEANFGAEMRNRLIEAHHDIPLSALEHGGSTKLSDLKLLCPNCHRAIHQVRGAASSWMSVDDFKKRYFPK